ncbi:MAG: prolyl oligopeptidase family serine peptidase [Planctomycetes bacterium]|nr:prolyl oligopeptidase family serine peptidase [Planctomycetota bacterium]
MSLRSIFVTLLLLSPLGAQDGGDLLTARRGFTTKLERRISKPDEVPEFPASLFDLVRYETSIGKMKALISRPEPGAKKSPAIIWLIGGFPLGGIEDCAWLPQDPENDQGAAAYRQAGLIMMYPTLRGSFANPGCQESYFGEVDDVLSALAYLKQRPEVDPDRIYLGGHSTGGTLALLVATASDGFAGIFAFGAADDPSNYGDKSIAYDQSNSNERRLRAPIRYLAAVKSPTWVICGTERDTAESLKAMQAATTNPALRFCLVAGADHFDILGTSNELIAGKLAKLPAGKELKLDAKELQKNFDDFHEALRESEDLQTLARIRLQREIPTKAVAVRHDLWTRNGKAAQTAAAAAKEAGFEGASIKEPENEDGWHRVSLESKLALRKLDAVFKLSRAAEELARSLGMEYGGWGLAD